MSGGRWVQDGVLLLKLSSATDSGGDGPPYPLASACPLGTRGGWWQGQSRPNRKTCFGLEEQSPSSGQVGQAVWPR